MINKMYHTEGYYNGKKVIIDLAEIGTKYEVMTLTPDGTDLDCKRYSDLQAAINGYRNMVAKYKHTDVKPLSGRYAKLKADLVKAIAAGKAAELAEHDDGGTCNFDSPMLYMPRWRAALVKQAAEEAGTRCYERNLYGGKCFVFAPITGGQANARTRNAEAMADALKNMGYTAGCYYAMD